MQEYPKIEAASDHSVLVTFGAAISPRLNERVRRLFLSYLKEPARGIINLHPGYASLLVDIDPLAVSFEEIETDIRRRLTGEDSLAAPESRLLEVPVCYGGRFGPDLEAVAAHCAMSAGQVVALHSAAEYLVYFLGFSPGFPYLGGLHPDLHTPRLESPRKLVPAGSVAIGGSQTGIYPLASPGGWRIIGRTPLCLFDHRRRNPALIEMGDSVRFRPITDREFAEIEDRD